MAAYLERRTSRAAGWACRSAAFSAVLFLTAGLAHRYGLLDTMPFLWVLSIVVTLAAMALVLAGYAFSRFWNHGDGGGRDLAVGGLVALIVLAPFLLTAYRAFLYPPLNDISTDLVAPPTLTVAAISRTAEMNAISGFTSTRRGLQGDNYPEVTGRRYEMPFDRAVDIVQTVLDRQGWVLNTSLPPTIGRSEVTMEALAHTLVLGFPADIAVRLIDEGSSTYVDMRSASRYGRHDLGDNAARIIAFLAELDAEFAAQAGLATAD